MSNQPPVRPWSRLASIRSVPPQPAPAAPQPRPPLTIPSTFRNIRSTPTEATPPPPPSAPVPPPAPPPLASPVRVAPSVAERLPPSPTTRAAQPPSQLRTRSEAEPRIQAEAEAEPKTVVVQKSIEKPKPWSTKNGEFQKEPGTDHNGKQIPSKEIESKEKHFHRKISDPKDSGMRVITIAGENRGAYMEIIRSSKKQENKNLHNNDRTKIKSSGGESEGSSNEDGKAAADKDSKSRRGKTVSSFPMTAFMNSNVQCVNNSIMFDASCKHNDPGVHLVLTKKPAGDGRHFKERVNGQ